MTTGSKFNNWRYVIVIMPIPSASMIRPICSLGVWDATATGFGRYEGRLTIRAFWRGLADGPVDCAPHLTVNHLIDAIDGDEATGALYIYILQRNKFEWRDPFCGQSRARRPPADTRRLTFREPPDCTAHGAE